MAHDDDPKRDRPETASHRLPTLWLNYQVTRRKSWHHLFDEEGKPIAVFARTQDMIDAIDAMDIGEFLLRGAHGDYVIQMQRIAPVKDQ